SGRRRSLNESLVARILSATSRWDSDCLGRCLAYFYETEAKLSPEIAFIVAENDSRTPSSTIVRRHESRFRELFLKKYDGRFPTRMELRASQRPAALNYHAASPTLLQLAGNREFKI